MMADIVIGDYVRAKSGTDLHGCVFKVIKLDKFAWHMRELNIAVMTLLFTKEGLPISSNKPTKMRKSALIKLSPLEVLSMVEYLPCP